MKYLIFILLIINGSCLGKKSENQPPYHTFADINTPVEFAEGNITTSNGINFSNDGLILYISKPLEKTFANGKPFMGIFKCNYNERKWSSPELVEFEPQIDAYHPVLSMDNKTMFFNSRSHPDSANLSVPHNIWMSKKIENGWSRPRMVDRINSSTYDSYPTIAKNENLYFNSDRLGGKGGMDIYISQYINGKYQQPINIEKLNSSNEENDLVVDPNERFIIFNRYVNSTKELDLYISHKEGNDWSEPHKLNKVNSPNEWELTPTLSPDGKYFFYELNGKIMQIGITELLEYN